MSLGENSLVAAYQGEDSEKSTIRKECGDNSVRDGTCKDVRDRTGSTLVSL